VAPVAVILETATPVGTVGVQAVAPVIVKFTFEIS
jgi:hypothetical protein